ncbi:ParH-like protein [Streptomyces sp. HPF1205]|uniref:ParH-like protein n=1 Tax=Streptomyces sp. HPF1205 TaxID=2873262 RepID=UPI001CEDFCFA|nr:ParH-like protein [Streptomyces sp. HPF1205]
MRTGRGDRRLWHRCRNLVDGLPLPNPFDTATFVGVLAMTRGRPIRLVPVTARPHLPCGLLVSTDDTDCILYPADTTPLHQQHIQLHEAAHILCGHQEASAVAASAAEVLLPHLPASLVARVLGRTVYTEPQEEEAELVASLILHRAARLARADAAAPPPAGPEEARLRSLFVPGSRAPRE